MSNSVSGEEQEATELLDETQRLRHKRDLLTKENEQLKSYLRLRQMESTATCEQLKSEIEQQIEQFEALGDQPFSDSQTTHLETLKSFRSEIEAIQCWNAKIRSKYFARASPDGSQQQTIAEIAGQITDELIEEAVGASINNNNNNNSSNTSDNNSAIDCNNTCDKQSVDVSEDNRSEPLEEDLNEDKPKQKNIIKRKTNPKRNANIKTDILVKEIDIKTNKVMTRSKQKLINESSDNKRKTIDRNEDKTGSKRSKRKKK